MAEYVNPGFEVDPITIETAIYDYIQEIFPDFSPKQPHLAVILSEAISQQVSELMFLATDVPPEIFVYLGQLFGIVPDQALPALSTVTFTAIDNLGYTVPSGTQMRILISGQDYVGFETLDDAVIVAGTTVLAGVPIQAIEEGIRGNGLDNDPELTDILDKIESVTLDEATSGGVDFEDIDTYMDKLTTRLQLLADHIVLASDAEKFAYSLNGVARVLAIDNYNPVDHTFDNEKMIGVVALDEDGLSVVDPLKSTIEALIESAREVNFIVNMFDPDLNDAMVATQVRRFASFEDAAVMDGITSSIMAYFNPLFFNSGSSGLGTSENVAAWVNETKLRYLEVAQVINEVDGVNYIESLFLGLRRAATAAASTDIVTLATHGFVLNDPVMFTDLTGGAGLVDGTMYYARDITTNTFKVAAAPSGGVVDITSDLTAGKVAHMVSVDIDLVGDVPLIGPDPEIVVAVTAP